MPNLLKLKTPGIIPIQNSSEGDKLAIGVSQKVVLRAVPVFYLIRLKVIETSSFEEQQDAALESDSDAQSVDRFHGSGARSVQPFHRSATASTGITDT